MPKDIRFDLSPTQYRFVTTEAHIAMLTGPMGEGKTHAGVAGLIAHAERCGRDIRTALIRDTFQNIKTSTIPDLKEILGSWVRFSDGLKKMVIMSTPKVECDLFGIDDEASISKLQGPQYACIWLEEPAPIYEKANAGLPREVFNMALARAARQSGTAMRVQITQNPADEEHWTSELIEEPEDYMVTDDGQVIRKEVFQIPKGENRYLNSISRAATMAAFKDDPAKWQRYVEGKIATVHMGKKVTPGYHAKNHFSKRVLPVFKGEAISLWDSWQNPCCIISQYTPKGQLVAHDVCLGEEIGTKELIEEQIDPLLNSLKYKDKITSWRIIGDPSMKQPDQSSVKTITSKVVEARFDAFFESGPVRWPKRKEPLNRCFKRYLNDGEPAVILSGSATKLHRALKGGWHYKTDNNGNIIGDKPVKNVHSHPGDAFSYGIAVLMPYDPKERFKQVAKEVKKKNIAKTYRGGNYTRGRRSVVAL